MSIVHDEHRIECMVRGGLIQLLGAFNRTLSGLQAYRTLQTDTFDISIIVRLEWGQEVYSTKKLYHSDMMQYSINDLANKIMFELFFDVLPEGEVMEDVAEELLPPDALDRYTRIKDVANTVVIQ